ncbi:tyrosinase family protein [Azotobacter salinestris]|uniref:tyrosinase family protein n=1 Tax=Azotobacter salinestris TaxID=69964 RepID=UPI0032DF8EBE
MSGFKDDQPAGLSRRSLLKAGAALSVLMATGHAGANQGKRPPAPGLKIRKAFNKLSVSEIESIRTGIRVMKERPESDPTSWWYQANIHGTYTTPTEENAKKTWSNCPHGTYHFLPWHRMYLYYFEKILREAARDPNLALPYWNYTDPDYLDLPEAFRIPASSLNPLWYQDRLPFRDEATSTDLNIGAGDKMPWALIDPTGTMEFINFCSSVQKAGNDFASAKADWIHFTTTFGALESQPHNNVHLLVGGLVAAASGDFLPGAQLAIGSMSDINKAANDPVFWFHHSNIDRLWDHWISLGGGRSDPIEEQEWMQTGFTFFEPDGSPVQVRIADVLDSEKLGYRYDTLELTAAGQASQQQNGQDVAKITSCTATAVTAALAADHGGHAAEQKVAGQATGSGQEPALLHKGGRASAKVMPPVAAVPEKDSKRRVILHLQGISAPMHSFLLPVFANLPSDEKPSLDSPYLVGTISMFGATLKMQPMKFDRTFDVTEALRKQVEKGLYSGGEITVTVAGTVPQQVTVDRIRIEYR